MRLDHGWKPQCNTISCQRKALQTTALQPNKQTRQTRAILTAEDRDNLQANILTGWLDSQALADMTYRTISRGPRFPYPIAVWFPVAGKNGEKRGKTGKNGGKTGKNGEKRGENGEKRGISGGGVFWTRPTHPNFTPPPTFIILWGAFFANQIEAKALSRVRHPSPKG